MAIKAVIWDVGGVLLRTENYAPRQYLADRLGMMAEDLENLVFSNASGMRAQRGEILAEGHWHNIRQRFGLDEKGLNDFRRDFFGGDVLDLGLLDQIRDLRSQYKIGILTNAFSDSRHLLTETWAIADMFDDLVISAEVGVAKPDERIFLLALERLDVLPREAVFIDDFLQNVDGARAVNINAVHFQNPEQAWEDLQRILSAGYA
jgi:epoxide hydrolase-like predicted phosphatase